MVVRSCLVSFILTPLVQTMWLTQIFVDSNIFNKGERNDVGIEQTLKRIDEQRRTDKTKTKLNEATPITHKVFTQIKQSMKIRCNRTYISFEAIVLKLIFKYYNTLATGLHQVT